MSGGGGSTGKVSFPQHMAETHQEWLGYNGSPTTVTPDLPTIMNTALQTNPLESVTYDNPSARQTVITNASTDLDTDVSALDNQADWASIVSQAVSKADTTGVLQDFDIVQQITDAEARTVTQIQNAITTALESAEPQAVIKVVEEYERSRRKGRERMKTQFKAGMSNVSAERSSAYAIGLALMEIDFERETGEFQSRLTLNNYKQAIAAYAQILQVEISSRIRGEMFDKENRDKFMVGGVQAMLSYKEFVFQMKQSVSQLTIESNRIAYVMGAEYTKNTMELNWKFAVWDFEVFKQGTVVLGGIGGGQFVPEGPSTASSAIGGALSGAATGAAVGTAIAPGIGTAIGAGVGAIAGGLSGLL